MFSFVPRRDTVLGSILEALHGTRDWPRGAQRPILAMPVFLEKWQIAEVLIDKGKQAALPNSRLVGHVDAVGAVRKSAPHLA